MFILCLALFKCSLDELIYSPQESHEWAGYYPHLTDEKTEVCRGPNAKTERTTQVKSINIDGGPPMRHTVWWVLQIRAAQPNAVPPPVIRTTHRRPPPRSTGPPTQLH